MIPAIAADLKKRQAAVARRLARQRSALDLIARYLVKPEGGGGDDH